MQNRKNGNENKNIKNITDIEEVLVVNHLIISNGWIGRKKKDYKG